MDKLDLWKKAVSIRKKLGEDATSPVDIFTLAYAIDQLTIVYYPMGEHLSGMCIKNEGCNVIAVNSDMTLGRQRFSLAHELYHLFFDEVQSTSICAKQIGQGSDKEAEADQFASYLLIPPNALSDMIAQSKMIKEDDKITTCDVVRLEQYFQVSRQAILYRLVGENELTSCDAEPMRKNVIASAINLGFTDALYRQTPNGKQYGTFGHYIQQADQVLERGLISDGKYEELLMEAFRADLVYGEDREGGEIID